MSRRGFTLVELLGVIATIAVLAAILIAVFAKCREQARSQTCRTNLLNIGLALRAYAADHDGRYPPRNDDLTPLVRGYLVTTTVFLCPSGGSTALVPMGAPADARVPLKPPEPFPSISGLMGSGAAPPGEKAGAGGTSPAPAPSPAPGGT
jgi:prepilin-type N-terminal cleavage/methylation domain-containing protein